MKLDTMFVTSLVTDVVKVIISGHVVIGVQP